MSQNGNPLDDQLGRRLSLANRPSEAPLALAVVVTGVRIATTGSDRRSTRLEWLSVSVDRIQRGMAPGKPHVIDAKLRSVLAGATAGLLLVSVTLRLVQDVPFFRTAGPLSDPVVAALVVVEAFPIGAGALLGLGAALIAWLSWTNKLRNRTAVGIVFGLVLAGGLLLGARSYAPAEQVGWALVLLSTATLLAFFRFQKPPLKR